MYDINLHAFTDKSAELGRRRKGQKYRFEQGREPHTVAGLLGAGTQEAGAPSPMYYVVPVYCPPVSAGP